MNFFRNNSKGITALEVVLSIGIIVVLVGIGLNTLLPYKDTSELNAAAESVLSAFQESRSRTLSSEAAMQYGVHLESVRVVMFNGASYDSGATTNKEVLLPLSIEISSWSLNGGGADAVFERLTGETDQYGTVTLRVIGNPSKTKTITLGRSGIAAAN